MSDEIRVEVINPSDPISMDVSDREAAALALVLVSRGQYATKPTEDGFEIPLFLFGGADEWWQENFNAPLEGSRERIGEERVVKALRSFRLDTKERSSMNDMVGYAHKLADKIEGKPGDDTPPPRSVMVE